MDGNRTEPARSAYATALGEVGPRNAWVTAVRSPGPPEACLFQTLCQQERAQPLLAEPDSARLALMIARNCSRIRRSLQAAGRWRFRRTASNRRPTTCGVRGGEQRCFADVSRDHEQSDVRSGVTMSTHADCAHLLHDSGASRPGNPDTSSFPGRDPAALVGFRRSFGERGERPSVQTVRANATTTIAAAP